MSVTPAPTSAERPQATLNPKVTTYPVPEGYFPDVQLTEAQTKGFEAQAQIMVKNTLVDYDMHEAGVRPDDGNSWKVSGHVGDLTAMKCNTGGDGCQGRIFGRINGDYRNFLNFYYAETPRQLFAWNQFMYGCAVDAAVLKNIHTVQSGKPHMYLGIKWVCMQPLSIVKKRDFCFLEYMAFTKDLRGRNIGIRVTTPLVLPECPPLPDKMKAIRMDVQMITIVRAADDDPNVTEFFLMGQGNELGFVVSNLFCKMVMGKMHRMPKYVDAKLIAVHGMLCPSEWVNKKARASCRLCSRDFSVTRHRQHCRLCGDIFCRQCLISRVTSVPDRDDGGRTFKTAKTKFCRVCVSRMRQLDASLLVPGRADSMMLSEEKQLEATSTETFADSGASTKPSCERSFIGSFADDMIAENLELQCDSDSDLMSTFRSFGDMAEAINFNDVLDDEYLEHRSQWRPACVRSGVDMSRLMSPSRMFRKMNAGTSFDAGSSASAVSPESRSISQSIAEQELLLRRLLDAARVRS